MATMGTEMRSIARTNIPCHHRPIPISTCERLRSPCHVHHRGTMAAKAEDFSCARECPEAQRLVIACGESESAIRGCEYLGDGAATGAACYDEAARPRDGREGGLGRVGTPRMSKEVKVVKSSKSSLEASAKWHCPGRNGPYRPEGSTMQ